MKKISKLVLTAMSAAMVLTMVGCSTTKEQPAPAAAPEPVVEPAPMPEPEPAPEPVMEPKPDRG